MTLVEASDHILGTFDCRLVDYVSSLFAKRRIRVLTNTSVVKVEKNVAFLQVSFNLTRRCVCRSSGWSALA